jgi:predicted nuclease of predicted toxin-antitoxin system
MDVIHVRDRGMNGHSDAAVFERAFIEDRVVVTQNIADYVRLARSRGLHGGLILLEDGGTRAEQLQLVEHALELVVAELAAGRDMVNRALYLGANGHTFVALPAEP